MVAIMQFISIFGIASVVGVRKRLPCMEQRLRQSNNNDNLITTSRVGVQLLDVINIVNVQAYEILGPRPANGTFAFHGNGYKGIDLIYCSDLSSVRISVRYSCLTVSDALPFLNSFGVASNEPEQHRRPFTDEEIELLLPN